MTREELIDKICPECNKYNCNDRCCEDCDEQLNKWLDEYEKQIRADGIREFSKECRYLLNCGMGKKKSIEHLIKILEKEQNNEI